MVKRDDISDYLSKLLGKELIEKAARVDAMPNGVQIHGRDEVEKVVMGVSASFEFVKKAVEVGALYTVVHHGLTEMGIVRGRFEMYEKRLGLIFEHGMTLAGFHYVLDAHPTLGNNALIIEALGAINTGEPYYEEWGYVAEFDKSLKIDELADKCAQVFGHDVYVVKAGKERVKRVGVCSGGARLRGNTFMEVVDKKLDAVISGEINEQQPYMAEEGGYNYLSCGHYATETLGVQALAKKVKEHFGEKLEVEFIDIPSDL